MKTFFHDLKASVMPAEFLARFRDRRVGQAAGFIYKLGLVHGLLILFLFATLIPLLMSLTNGTLVDGAYPPGLEITIKDGTASINAPEPYIITMPRDEHGNAVATSTKRANLLVIDTKTVDPLTAITTYDTEILLSKDKLVYSKDGGEIRAISLSSFGDITITKDSVKNFLKEVAPLAYGGVVVLAIVIVAAVALFAMLYYLVVLLFLALITLLVSRSRHLSLSYKESYVVSAYALALPMLLNIILNFFHVPYNFLIMLVLFSIIILRNLKTPTA